MILAIYRTKLSEISENIGKMNKKYKEKRLLIYLLLILNMILIIILCLILRPQESIQGFVSKPEIEPEMKTNVGFPIFEEGDQVPCSVSSNEIRPQVTFSGRWFEKEINGVRAMVTLNDGASFWFKTEGISELEILFMEITALETPYYTYIIDGNISQRQKITQKTILLPDNHEHVVQIVIDGINEREDKWNGEIGVAFAGINSKSGKITPVPLNKKQIIFVGDSITEGIMALSDNALSDYNSATHSFPWYTAQFLNAEPYFVGYGATGIVATGSFSTCENMLDYYSADREIPLTEFPPCDLVVINMGTNDFGVESPFFIEEYQKVLKKLHERYLDVDIICMIPFTQLHAEDIRKAAENYEWCHVIETADWELTYSDGIHPDVNGAKLVAEKLYQYIIENDIGISFRQ